MCARLRLAVDAVTLEISGVCVEQSEFLGICGICHFVFEAAANQHYMLPAQANE